MGNALSFQTKFERIQSYRERQNFPAVWAEYGDLIYLIWNFSPIDEASLEDMDSFIERWLEDQPWLTEDTPAAMRAMIHSAVSTLSELTHQSGEAFGEGLGLAKKAIKSRTPVVSQSA